MVRRVLLDVDILLDVLLNRDPFVEDSSELWQLIESEQIEGYVTPTTLNQIFDIGKENKGIEIAWLAVSEIRAIMKVCPIDGNILETASSLQFLDFEAAVQFACATVMKLDYIVSRKFEYYKWFLTQHSQDVVKGIVSIVRPSEFLTHLFSNRQAQYWMSYFHEGEKRSNIVYLITSNSKTIVTNSTKAFFFEQFEASTNAYTDEQTDTLIRGMTKILRHVTYALLIGDSHVLDKQCLNSLYETSQMLNIPIYSAIFSVKKMKDITLKFVNESNIITPNNYFNMIDELASYFDLIIATVD